MGLRQETIDNIFHEAYKRMYSETDPKLDFDKASKTDLVKRQDWFMVYYLAQERQNEIIEKVLDEFKIKNKHQRRAIRNGVALGCSPNGSEVGVERFRRKVIE